MLDALVATRGRVIGRAELTRRSGMAGLSERRVDAVLVEVRRALGEDALVTVRGRGWMIAPEVDVSLAEDSGRDTASSA